jgi:hypothetical protein
MLHLPAALAISPVATPDTPVHPKRLVDYPLALQRRIFLPRFPLVLDNFDSLGASSSQPYCSMTSPSWFSTLTVATTGSGLNQVQVKRGSALTATMNTQQPETFAFDFALRCPLCFRTTICGYHRDSDNPGALEGLTVIDLYGPKRVSSGISRCGAFNRASGKDSSNFHCTWRLRALADIRPRISQLCPSVVFVVSTLTVTLEIAVWCCAPRE